jgi:hypothetical protein
MSYLVQRPWACFLCHLSPGIPSEITLSGAERLSLSNAHLDRLAPPTLNDEASDPCNAQQSQSNPETKAYAKDSTIVGGTRSHMRY